MLGNAEERAEGRPAELDAAAAATESLLALCLGSAKTDPSLVRAYVRRGADVTYSPPPSPEEAQYLEQEAAAGRVVQMPPRNSPLHHLLARHDVESVLACLETKRPINFMVLGSNGASCLHLACSVKPPDEGARLMAHIVRRVEEHMEDKVSWSQRTTGGGDDFLSRAAAARQLHRFWPLLENVPEFADATEPIPIKIVHQEDWELLEPEEKAALQPQYIL